MSARSILPLVFAFTYCLPVFAQPGTNTIRVDEVTRIETTLASNEMEGRRTFTPGIDKAAAFINKEFSRIGLQFPAHQQTYHQTFSMIQSTVEESKVLVNGREISSVDIICLTSGSSLNINPDSGYEIVRVGNKDNLMAQFRTMRGMKGNVIAFIDTIHTPLFNRIKQNTAPRMPSANNTIYILTSNTDATDFSIELQVKISTKELSNVVAILPGKSKPDEYVIFSAHYDHLGYGRPDENGDSLYNGANDDASGTTAVIALADYFKGLANNERTLIFAAFTAEEIGGFGSQYFSKQYAPEKVIAMFNIEMIGTDSKWGKNAAYITGYEKSNMGSILEKNLEGTAFTFYPDPYPQQQLFYRSDNATLARLGVPAHTVSTSKMDIEPHYHKASDEVSTLDLDNMTEIIKAIALSSRSIIAGIDTPARVDTSQLR